MGDKIKLIFATGNKNKVNEVKKILDSSKFEITGLEQFENVPSILEDGDSFEDNAKIKATVIYNKFKTPVIADDSGLSVEQLNGLPGVYSARYAGQDSTDDENNNMLLFELSDFDLPHKASFICTAVFFDGKNFITAEGELKGEIIDNSRGKNGFGYDPIFVPEGYDKTLAEFESEEKNKISHRAEAFRKLEKELVKYYNL